MKIPKHLLACLLLLGLGACATDALSGRIREKPAVYAALSAGEKSKIAQGIVALGFTMDMVYLAMGRPTKIEPVEKTGGRAELWVYQNYYPAMEAAHLQHAGYRTEAPYQPSRTYAGSNVPIGLRHNQESTPVTGGPQGTMTEPADLPACTLRILFQDGKVKRIGIAAE